MSRIFEDLSNQYLIDLKNNGIIIDGAIVGVNEHLETSTAKVTIVGSNDVNESFIIIYKLNGNLTWKFLNRVDNELNYEYSETGWHYPQFSKRIIAPLQLIFEYVSFEVWFRVNNLPIKKVDQSLYCYCNEILPEHQTLVDSLNGVITIEDRP
jgi:hypothetical protein